MLTQAAVRHVSRRKIGKVGVSWYSGVPHESPQGVSVSGLDVGQLAQQRTLSTNRRERDQCALCTTLNADDTLRTKPASCFAVSLSERTNLDNDTARHDNALRTLGQEMDARCKPLL